MWEISLFGISLYNIAGWFWLYSFLGWIWETSYVSIANKKFVNRGFVSGPVLTIYGFGAVLLYLLLHKVKNNIFLLYIGGVFFATLLEYITAVLMEKIFHASWWDYSKKKFNFQGRICLQSSIAWGFFTILLLYILHPAVCRMFDYIPQTCGELLISAATVIYAADFGISVITALNLKERLEKLEDIREDFIEFLQTSKIAELVEDFRESTESFKNEYALNRMHDRLELSKQKLSDKLNLRNSDMKEDILAHFDAFSEKYIKNKEKLDKITKRYIKAYPNLKMHKNKKKKTKI